MNGSSPLMLADRQPIPDVDPHRGPNASLTPPRILLVDDEESILRALQATLRHANYETVACDDPFKAIEELKRQDYALVISDQRMTGLSGLELLAEARRIQPFATRILITAVLSLDVVMDAINKGEIYRFLAKPWLRDEFLTTVRNGIQRYELLRQNAQLHETTAHMNKRLVELNRLLEQQVQFAAEQNSQLAEMNAALEQNATRSMGVSLHTLHAFYPALGEQVRRVSQLCQAIAQTLKLSKSESRILESSALLYDIGLVAIPRHIIQRWQENPEALTAADHALIVQHPAVGQKLAEANELPKPIGQIIRAHHERYDGTGYPDRLAGNEIPWLARILATAVTFASAPLTIADAVELVKSQANSSLDPEAVRVFLQSLPKGRSARNIKADDLRPGMVLAENIYSRSGFIIAPEGQALSEVSIERVLSQNDQRQILQPLLVYC